MEAHTQRRSRGAADRDRDRPKSRAAGWREIRERIPPALGLVGRETMDAMSSPRTSTKRPRVSWSDEPVVEVRTYLMSPEENAHKIEVFNEVQQRRKMLRHMVARAAQAIVASSSVPPGVTCATLLCSEELHRDANGDALRQTPDEAEEEQQVGSGRSDENGAATKPEPSGALVRPAAVARLRRGSFLLSKCLLPQRSQRAENVPYDNATLRFTGERDGCAELLKARLS